MGFFVSRHLGLLLCNIAIMKRFLPLLMFTCLLFGQDEEMIYSTLVDTNYEHGTFEFTPAVYKFTMEGSNIENVIPAFSYIKDISEDGTRIIFTANDSIMLYNDGLIDTLSIIGMEPKFIHDGDIIFSQLFLDNLYRLYKFSFEDSSQSLIADSVYLYSLFYKLSPDKQKVVYLEETQNDSFNIMTVDITSGTKTFIITIPNIWLSDIYWAYDNYLYLSLRDNNNLYQLFKINSSGIDDTPTQLTFFDNGCTMLATNDSHLDKIILNADSCSFGAACENNLLAFDFESNQTSYIGGIEHYYEPITHAWSKDNSKVAVGTMFAFGMPGPGFIKTFNTITGDSSMIAMGLLFPSMNFFWVNDSNNLEISNVINVPNQFKLYQNYPNPFNPITSLRFDLNEDSFVSITIYDMMGRVIKNLLNNHQTSGYKTIQWDATNNYGKPVSAGIYLYQIQAGKYISTKKMVLLK